MITAVLGWLIFAESLPGMWFLGAGLLVAGNVIIGRREEGEKGGVEGEAEEERLVGEEVEMDGGEGEGDGGKDEDEDVVELGDLEGDGEEDLLDLRSR